MPRRSWQLALPSLGWRLMRAERRTPRRLIAGYAVDGLLEWATSIALLVWSYDRTGSAIAAGALLIAKQAAPGLLAPSAGRILDRHGARLPLASGLVLRAAGTAGALLAGSTALLLPLAVVAGSGGMLVRASLRTTAATSFDGEQRRRTNALTNTTMGVTSMAGPALGGAAVAATSPTAVGLVAACAGAVAAGALAVWPPAGRGQNAAQEDLDIPGDPGAGHDRKPRPRSRLAALGAVAAVAALLAMDEPALLPFATQALSADTRAYGAILGAWGAGIIIGSLWLTRLSHRSMLAVALWGAALVAAAYLGLAASPNVGIATAVAVVGGIGNGLDWMALVTALQERTPAAEQGRLAADLEAVIAIGPPIGYLVGGALTDGFGPRAPFLLGGALTLVVLAAVTGLIARRDEPAAGLTPAGVANRAS